GSIKRHIKRKRPGTIGLCASIKHKYGVDPVPHLICEGFTKEETEDALIELNYLGIDNVLTIRGDAPDDTVTRFKNGTYNDYAIDLVKQVNNMNRGTYLEEINNAQKTDFCVGVAGYPEKHFEAPNLDYDIARLKEKIEAGGDYIVTQMFFDNEAFFRFEKKCRAAGIDVPIVPGLKVLTRGRHLNFLPKYFHLNIPEALSEAVQADPSNARSIGIEWSAKQCAELLEHGVPGLHFYIMGDPSPALKVIDELPMMQKVAKN
ncbi:MAG: methylenetetrahydrofolate reductase, partial [Balneolaceae bacterium]|nr:methylenetetrahydrofolate reductase [Balneolaceae bacterium]